MLQPAVSSSNRLSYLICFTSDINVAPINYISVVLFKRLVDCLHRCHFMMVSRHRELNQKDLGGQVKLLIFRLNQLTVCIVKRVQAMEGRLSHVMTLCLSKQIASHSSNENNSSSILIKMGTAIPVIYMQR